MVFRLRPIPFHPDTHMITPFESRTEARKNTSRFISSREPLTRGVREMFGLLAARDPFINLKGGRVREGKQHEWRAGKDMANIERERRRKTEKFMTDS